MQSARVVPSALPAPSLSLQLHHGRLGGAAEASGLGAIHQRLLASFREVGGAAGAAANRRSGGGGGGGRKASHTAAGSCALDRLKLETNSSILLNFKTTSSYSQSSFSSRSYQPAVAPLVQSLKPGFRLQPGTPKRFSGAWWGLTSLAVGQKEKLLALPGGSRDRMICCWTKDQSGERGGTEPGQEKTTEAKSPERGTDGMSLFPPIEPHRSGRLKVSDVHTLYWEESGNPEGQPIVFLHGGPGGGTSAANRRFFDPSFYRIILFDQRGSGRSEPHASLEQNTTWDLVGDIERLREELKVQKWLVFGGSWGSTLALSYAISHADKVQGLILRGIFLLRQSEIDWFYQKGGAERIFSDAFDEYCGFVPEDEQHDLVAAYHKRLMDETNPDVQMAAAKRWTAWEMATSYLLPSADSLKRGESDHFALAFARIENHYFFNKGFFETDNFLLENVDKIKHIPGTIVQGRYDVVCPFISAWDLHKSWPEAEFKVVPNAGHSANEISIAKELVDATERAKTWVS